MNYKTKILIVEDEAIIAESIKLTIESLGYEVVGVSDNALDAIELLNKNKVDLAILDINIQGEKNGIWLAKNMFQDKPFIYLTAYGDSKTIEQASKTKPSAYLLKPFKKEDISVAIQMAIINYSNNKTAQVIQNSNAEEKSNIFSKKESFFIKQKSAFIKLQVSDILFMEADKNYVKIQTTKEQFVIRNTLKDIIGNLPDFFLQVHRSFIININHIDKILPLSIKLKGFTIPLGNLYKKELIKKIHTIN
jgi:DNA-binding LytR/AlgR family response regulator